METRLVRRAVRGYSIRAHGDVYQVFFGRVRPTTTPAFTTRDFGRAEEWIATHRAPGAGRPAGSITTGSQDAKRVTYRVSAEQRAELDAEGDRIGVSGDLAAKRRAFP